MTTVVAQRQLSRGGLDIRASLTLDEGRAVVMIEASFVDATIAIPVPMSAQDLLAAALHGYEPPNTDEWIDKAVDSAMDQAIIPAMRRKAEEVDRPGRPQGALADFYRQRPDLRPHIRQDATGCIEEIAA